MGAIGQLFLHDHSGIVKQISAPERKERKTDSTPWNHHHHHHHQQQQQQQKLLPYQNERIQITFANLITEHLDIAVGCWASLTAQNVPSDVGFVGSKRLAYSQGGGVPGVWFIAPSEM